MHRVCDGKNQSKTIIMISIQYQTANDVSPAYWMAAKQFHEAVTAVLQHLGEGGQKQNRSWPGKLYLPNHNKSGHGVQQGGAALCSAEDDTSACLRRKGVRLTCSACLGFFCNKRTARSGYAFI